jgi:2-methylcitrate dehydratase PrpD
MLSSEAATTPLAVTRVWADRLGSTRYEDLPPSTIERARSVLLDLLGVALIGRSAPISRICEAYFTRLGGVPEARVLGSRHRLPALHAATLNGLFAHALDLDDGHPSAAGHPGAVTIPAALAAAETGAASGVALLRGIVLGYEVFVRLASAINPGHLRRGYHTTATVGPFAAAMASGAIHALTTDQLASALGLAGIQGAGYLGVMQDGPMGKPFQVSRASGSGILAVDLARAGAEGPQRVYLLEDDADLAPLIAPVGTWAIEGVYFKDYAACRHTHAAVDAAAAVRTRIRPERIESIRVHTYAAGLSLCRRLEWPTSEGLAKFSFPFTVACGLIHGHARQSCFTPEALGDERLRSLAARVDVEVDPDLEARYPAERGAILEVRLRDGGHLVEAVPVARGDPARPLSSDDVRAKFQDNAAGVLGPAAEQVIEIIDRLEQLPSCEPLLSLFEPR